MSELDEFALVFNSDKKPVLIIKATIKDPNREPRQVNERIFIDRYDLESMEEIISKFRGNR